MVGCNVVEPRVRCSLWVRGVKRKSLSFKLMYLCDDLERVHDEAARDVVSYDREVRGNGLRVIRLRCGA